MTFPDFETWCDTVLHPEDTSPWNFRTKEFYEEYRTKYAIAKLIQPKSILEIGVRFGYGAQSFLMGAPHASYMGLDADEPSWGEYQGIPREWATTRLCEQFPTSCIATHRFNTQTDDAAKLDLPFVDMVHIDGDHSFNGALKDMTTFWPLCERVMVVDDYIEIEAVAHAVDDFCASHTDAVKLPITSFRGAALLVRG